MADPNPSREAGADAILPFEVALERLERIVGQLEAGDLPLEEALRAFEEGVSLSRRCAEELEVAERRVEELVGSEVRPFEPSEDDDSNEADEVGLRAARRSRTKDDG